MARFKRKFKWKNILSFVLVGALLIGSVAVLGAIFNKDTKTISSTAFSVGGINAQGNYEETKLSIYTKDMFECQGLTIEPDFEATGTYQVFYYDQNKNFLDSTSLMHAEDGVYNKGDSFAGAQYARIVITPAVPVDEDGKEVEDFKIRFYEVSGYARDYTITVNKDQKFELENIWDSGVIAEKKIAAYNRETLVFEEREGQDYTNYNLLNVSEYNSLKVVFENGSSEDYSIYFYNADNVKIGGYVPLTGLTEFYIDIPDGSVTMGFNYGNYTEIAIYPVT